MDPFSVRVLLGTGLRPFVFLSFLSLEGTGSGNEVPGILIINLFNNNVKANNFEPY